MGKTLAYIIPILYSIDAAAAPSGFLQRLDPYAFALSAIGGVCMLSYFDPPKGKTPGQVRMMALSNFLISIIVGGLGGKVLASAIDMKWPGLGAPYLLSFCLSAGWQILIFKGVPWMVGSEFFKSWFIRKR